MTIIDQILSLLEKESLTSLEIANRLGKDKDLIFPKLSRLNKENRIMAINNEKPYKYITITKDMLLNYLKFLNDFFKDNQEYILRNEKILNFVLDHEEFDKIEVILENA